jgi:hypothetical protein
MIAACVSNIRQRRVSGILMDAQSVSIIRDRRCDKKYCTLIVCSLAPMGDIGVLILSSSQMERGLFLCVDNWPSFISVNIK